MSLSVPVYCMRATATMPRYGTPGAAAFDLEVSETTICRPGGPTLLPTGLIFAVPEGYFLAIFARSSTAKRGLVLSNSVGVLDSDYRGPEDECMIPVLNITRVPVVVEAGDRIAQGTILPCPQVTFTDHEPGERSRGGFGSTGK